MLNQCKGSDYIAKNSEDLITIMPCCRDAYVYGAGAAGAGKNNNNKTINVNLKGVDSVGNTIQKALDTALKDQSGKVRYKVVLPEGSYKLDTLLKIYSYTTLKMDDCTLVRDTNKVMLRFGQEETEYSGYGGQHDIVIEGGTWDGGGTKIKAKSSMIRLGHGKNITFKNITLQNVYMSHHIEIAGSANITFEGCTFKKYISDGKNVASDNNEALQFDVLHNEAHFPRYPTFDDTPCKNITVTGCTFKNLQRGLGTHTAVAGSYFTKMVFTNNTFTDIKGYAIVATNFINSNISNNKISKSGSGILFRSMVQGYNNFYTPLSGKVNIINDANSTISNNKITVIDQGFKTTAYGISLYGDKLTSKKKDVPKGDYTLKGVTVKNNTITMQNKGYGIWLQKANECKIKNNTVTMNIKASVKGSGNCDPIRLVSSKKNTIEKNTLTQKKNNKATKNACGIVITDKSQATLKSNKINNSCKDGVLVQKKSSVTMKNNTINKTGRDGVNITDSSSGTLTDNTVNNIGKDGVNITKSSSGTLTGNTIKNTEKNGITVFEKSTATIKENKISKYNNKATYADSGSKIKKKK